MNDPNLITTIALLEQKFDQFNQSLSQSLSDLTSELRQHRISTDQRVEALNEKLEAKLAEKADAERVGKIEGHLEWVWRIVVGAIILALVGLVLVKPADRIQPATPREIPAVHQTN